MPMSTVIKELLPEIREAQARGLYGTPRTDRIARRYGIDHVSVSIDSVTLRSRSWEEPSSDSVAQAASAIQRLDGTLRYGLPSAAWNRGSYTLHTDIPVRARAIASLSLIPVGGVVIPFGEENIKRDGTTIISSYNTNFREGRILVPIEHLTHPKVLQALDIVSSLYGYRAPIR